MNIIMRSSSLNWPPSLKYQHILFSALLSVLTLVSYFQVFSSGFIQSYDDEMYVTLNPFVSQGFTLEGLHWSLTSFYSGNWHPLTWWSHMMDVTLFAMNPAGHHAVSLIIHIANTLLLYSFFFRITGLRARSFLIAALFSLHPLHVESVAWVAERKDVLSAFFAFSALHMYITYIRSERKAHYLAMAMLLCLSLMSKPMLVTFPFLLLVLDYWPLERTRHNSFFSLFREKIPLFIPVAVISIISVIAQRSVGALMPLDNDGVATRLFGVLDAYAEYVRKFFAPFDLASFYPYTAVSGGRALLALTLLGLISATVWYFHQQRPWLLAGWLWFLGMLVPVIGIIRVGGQAYADRYMYLPIIGLIVMAVWGAAELLLKADPRGYANKVVSGLLIIMCAALTWIQAGYWHDSISLYSRELSVTARNWHAHFGLGNALANRNSHGEAVSHYYAALEIMPRSADTHNNLGASLRSLGRNHEAINHLLKAVEINPNYATAYFNLALTLAQLGNGEAVRQSLQKALLINPSFQEARTYLEELDSLPAQGSRGKE